MFVPDYELNQITPHEKFVYTLENLSLKDSVWNGFLVAKNGNLMRINAFQYIFQYINEKLFDATPPKNLLETATINYINDFKDQIEKTEEIALLAQLAENAGLNQKNETKDFVKETINCLFWSIIDNENSLMVKNIEVDVVKPIDEANVELKVEDRVEVSLLADSDEVKDQEVAESEQIQPEVVHEEATNNQEEIIREGQVTESEIAELQVEDRIEESSLAEEEKVKEQAMAKPEEAEAPRHEDLTNKASEQDKLDEIDIDEAQSDENSEKNTLSESFVDRYKNVGLWNLRFEKLKKLRKIERKIEDLEKKIALDDTNIKYLSKMVAGSCLLVCRSIFYYDAIVAPQRYPPSLFNNMNEHYLTRPPMPAMINQLNAVLAISSIAILSFNLLYYVLPNDKDIDKFNRLNEKLRSLKKTIVWQNKV